MSEIRQMRERYTRTEEQIQSKVKNTDNPQAAEYFLNPHLQLIHTFLSIDKYQKNPQLIEKALQIDSKKFNSYLDKLVELQIISIENKRIKVKEFQLFLSWKSLLQTPFQALSRINSIQKVQTMPKENVRTLSTIFSCTNSEAESIKSKLAEFYREIEELVGNCEKPDQVFQLNYDFFPWSEE